MSCDPSRLSCQLYSSGLSHMAVSEPLHVLPGQGKLGKPVTDCTELSLGSRGIEQLAGFERLVNLEVLWLQDNKLCCVANLDNNTRLQQLYVHNNRLCTLKGSLSKLKFLTHLDISHNQLKSIDKVLSTLQQLRFLQELNLQANPCCEEPQYRLLVLSALPSLKVLDHHEVTTHQRQQAACLTASGHIKVLPVAFGSHLPAELHSQQGVAKCTTALAATGHTGGCAGVCQQQGQQTQGSTSHRQKQQRQRQFSVLELELDKEVAAIKQRQQDATAAAEAALYASNPDAAYWQPRSSLPPNPALALALQTRAKATGATAPSNSGGSKTSVHALKLNLTAAAAAAAAAAAGGTPSGSLSLSTVAQHPHLMPTQLQAAAVSSTAVDQAMDQTDLAARGYLQGTFSYYHAGGSTAVARSATSSRQMLCC